MSTTKEKLENVTHSRTYKILYKRSIFDYCYICQRREGSYHAFCGPGHIYGYHGSHKRVFSTHYRAYRTWKHTRKTQWKDTGIV